MFCSGLYVYDAISHERFEHIQAPKFTFRAPLPLSLYAELLPDQSCVFLNTHINWDMRKILITVRVFVGHALTRSYDQMYLKITLHLLVCCTPTCLIFIEDKIFGKIVELKSAS